MPAKIGIGQRKYLAIGMKVAKDLEHTGIPLEVIGKKLGITKEGARKLAFIALGKLVVALKERYPDGTDS